MNVAKSSVWFLRGGSLVAPSKPLPEWLSSSISSSQVDNFSFYFASASWRIAAVSGLPLTSDSWYLDWYLYRKVSAKCEGQGMGRWVCSACAHLDRFLLEQSADWSLQHALDSVQISGGHSPWSIVKHQILCQILLAFLEKLQKPRETERNREKLRVYVFLFILLALATKSLTDVASLDSMLATEWTCPGWHC